jgi:hypothetical protein
MSDLSNLRTFWTGQDTPFRVSVVSNVREDRILFPEVFNSILHALIDRYLLEGAFEGFALGIGLFFGVVTAGDVAVLEFGEDVGHRNCFNGWPVAADADCPALGVERLGEGGAQGGMGCRLLASFRRRPP